ncbi:MAG TPA: NAD(P)(+) transhydrogenase (Re/Si-specific) subunit alpha, partial [Firmicutes bacterium]|nr:NAD(P)(+) transhydrogenase (Re/Si-specific) subunit alpha [Bacillota bacterium]
MQFQGLVLCVPKEIMPGERRVSAIPETVKKMISNGAKVLVEKGAGLGSYFSDDEYQA